MGTLKHQGKGAGEQIVGKAKQVAGRALDRPDLEDEGEGQQALGEGRSKLAGAIGRAKERLEDAGERAKDSAEDAAQHVKASAERAVGKVAKKVSEFTDEAARKVDKANEPKSHARQTR